jgi:hypothetical protein
MEMQRTKIGLKIAFDLLAAIALVIASLALTFVMGGGRAPVIAMAIIAVITGIAAKVEGGFESLQGIKDLETAKKRFKLNKRLCVLKR